MGQKLLYLLILTITISQLGFAGTRGEIKGKITDLKTGEVLIGANVVIVGTSLGAASDANGEFVIRNVQPGNYELKSSYIGYQTVTISNVRVNTDLSTEINIKLPAEGYTVNTVEVIAQKPLIQKDNTNAIRITSSEDIASLPVRNVNSILGLTAGVAVQNDLIFIRGGRSDEVGYYLEGVSVKNPMTNRNAVTISQDALEEIQVQAGGYTAEFGGANAGIVRQQLRSGGKELKASFEYITDNIGFKSRDNAYDGKKTLGAYWWGYTEASGVVSGPITDKIKFFANLNYLYNKDNNPQPYPGLDFGTIGSNGNNKDTLQNLYYAPGPRKGVQSHSTTFTGTLNYDLNPILIRVTGTFNQFSGDAGGGLPGTTSDFNTYGYSTFSSFLNNRLGQTDRTNGSFTVKITHIISPKIYYDITGGYYLRNAETYDRALGSDYWSYGDSSINAAHGWTIPRAPYDYKTGNPLSFGNTQTPRRLEIGDYFTFAQNGSVPVSYSKSSQNSFTLNGSLSILVGKIHSIKIGGEFQQYTIRNWSGVISRLLAQTLETQLKDASNAGKSLTEVKEEILRNQGVNNYGYDVLGNEYNGGGFDAAHKPIFASGYIQDKLEFSDLIINLGLRYDYFDNDNLIYKDPAYPELAINKANTNLDPNGYVKTKPYHSVSPRIGFSFPVTESSVFHAQYGKFVQQPQLGDMYEGYYSFAQKIRGGGNYYSVVSGPDLRPTRTTQYEIGFSQYLTEFLSLDVTGFYRDIRDQVVYSKQLLNDGSTFGSEYYILTNGDFATTKGVEITFSMRRFSRIQTNLNLAFQDARGTGSTSGADAGMVFQPVANTIYTPKIVAPLLMNRPFTANLSVDYRWSENDEPVALRNFGISAILTYNSGHPYTLGSGGNSAEFDARNRFPLQALNSSLTPSVFQVDLRVDKTIPIMNTLKVNLYVYVINLFDTQNINNVFLKTGTESDDGNVYTKDFQDKVKKYGKSYLDLYNALNIGYQLGYGGGSNTIGVGGNDNLYGTPRQIRLGVRVEY